MPRNHSPHRTTTHTPRKDPSMALHAHGSPRKVASGCGCNLCVLVRESTPRGYRMPTSVPVSTAQEHIVKLTTQYGWSIAALAKTLGYGESTLHAIRSGRWQFIGGALSEDILCIPLDPAPGWTPGAVTRPRPDLVLVDPAREHLEKLLEQGWTKRGIGDAAGCSHSTISLIASGESTWTRAAIADAILAIPVQEVAA